MGNNFVSILTNKNMTKFAIFDFDGTLADTFLSGAKLINQYAEQFGYQQIDFEKNKSLSARELIKLSKVKFWQIPKLIRFFRKKSEENSDEICAFQGVLQTIETIKNQGITLGIITTNSQKTINSFIKKYQLENYFEYIETDVSLFGKKRAIKRAKRYAKNKFQKIVYIGDEIRDIEACKKADIKIISVDWGFNSSEVLNQKNPGFVAGNAEELTQMIIKY